VSDDPKGPNERNAVIVAIVFKSLLVAAALLVALSPVLVGLTLDHLHHGRRRTPHYSAKATTPTVSDRNAELVSV